MDFGSEDLADLSKTTRVLTIMLAEDWRGGLLLAGFRGGLSKTTPELLLLIWGRRKEKQPPYIDGDTLEVHGQRIQRLAGRAVIDVRLRLVDTASIPSVAIWIPCACSCRTGRPPQPGRILRWTRTRREDGFRIAPRSRSLLAMTGSSHSSA